MYDRGGDNTRQIGVPVTNLHSITDDGDNYIASGVQFVQLKFTDADNGRAGWIELDVVGRQVPEPSTVALLGMTAIALVAVRNRR